MDGHEVVSLERTSLEQLLWEWDVKVSGCFPDACIAGSPERTLRRMVVVDTGGRAFVLEEIAPQAAAGKREIALLLAALSENGLHQVHPYLKDRRGSLITVWADCYWQLRPYIPGVFLLRPDYLNDAWRGIALADFLIDLRQAASRAEYDFPGEIFSIVHFIHDFMGKLAVHSPEICHELMPVRNCLAAKFFPVHNTLPPAFCHGDYHPLNIVWSEDAILSVIDWEFCGVKPEAYDLALLLGCLGMEDPRALKGLLVRSLLTCIRESGIYEETSLAALPDLVMAIRFAWLSEWLRKNDVEMVQLELDYLRLLLENRTEISAAWR